MTEPVQVGDGGIEKPDPVVENLRAFQELLQKEDFEGSAKQIAQAGPIKIIETDFSQFAPKSDSYQIGAFDRIAMPKITAPVVVREDAKAEDGSTPGSFLFPPF